jgi:hypothetical protein
MDPYLESPELWPGVHSTLMSMIREQLVPKLRPKYFVDVERRVYLLEEGDPARSVIVPDAVILAERTKARSGEAPPSTRRKPAVLTTMLEDIEIGELRLVVQRVGTRELVTVIELLSPTNKLAGSRGRDIYLAKRRDVLRSHVHLVEIDLLRGGERIPSPEPLPPGDYLVHVSRAEKRPRGEVYTWTVRETVPEIAIPLGKSDADVELDLGLALRGTYDRGGYDLVLNYRVPPMPPLRGDDQVWASERGFPI